MATDVGTYGSADRPTALSADELTTMAGFVPPESVVVTGLRVSGKKATVIEPEHDSVIVISAADDHTIHAATVTEVSPGHYEITDDHVIGHW